MINYDNNKFLNNKAFYAGILIAIPNKIMQLVKICLSPKGQALKPLSTALSFLLLTIASNCKARFVDNGFKGLRNLTIAV